MSKRKSNQKNAFKGKNKLNLIALPRNLVLLNGTVNQSNILFQDLLPKHVITLIFIIGQYELAKNTNQLSDFGEFSITRKKLTNFRSKLNRTAEIWDLIDALEDHPYIRYIALEGDKIEVQLTDFFFEELAKGKPYHINIDLIKNKEVAKSRDMILYVMLVDFNAFSGVLDRNQIIEVTNKIKSMDSQAATPRQKANRIQKIKAAFFTLQTLGYIKSAAYHITKRFKLTFKGLTKQFKYTPKAKKEVKAEWETDDILALADALVAQQQKAEKEQKPIVSNGYDLDDFGYNF